MNSISGLQGVADVVQRPLVHPWSPCHFGVQVPFSFRGKNSQVFTVSLRHSLAAVIRVHHMRWPWGWRVPPPYALLYLPQMKNWALKWSVDPGQRPSTTQRDKKWQLKLKMHLEIWVSSRQTSSRFVESWYSRFLPHQMCQPFGAKISDARNSPSRYPRPRWNVGAEISSLRPRHL